MFTSTVTQGFAGIWRLCNDGAWLPIHKRDLQHSGLEETSELLATLYAEYFGLGAELRADLGSHTLMARADDEGVLVGVHDSGTPALTIKTSMRRIDQASMRGLPSTMSSRQILQDDEPTTVERAILPQESEPFAVPPSSELAFEILFDEVLDDDDLEWPAPEAVSVTWAQVCTWLKATLDAVTPFVGRTVATNYWRQALDAQALLGPHIELGFRGSCTPKEPGTLQGSHTAAMERAYDHWLRRCRRVIPRIDDELAELKTAPWHIHGTKGYAP